MMVLSLQSILKQFAEGGLAPHSSLRCLRYLLFVFATLVGGIFSEQKETKATKKSLVRVGACLGDRDQHQRLSVSG
jgi:hypothetical protein